MTESREVVAVRGSGVDGEDEGAGAAVVAELAEVDALPGAEVRTAVGNGDCERHAD